MIDVVTLAHIIQTLNVLGKSTDVAGTGNVFSYLKRLEGFVDQVEGYADQVEGYTDQVEGLIGTASPAAGDLTTLFRGLKLIADYVDTLETKVGTNADAAGTLTIFARLAQIAAYVDTLEAGLTTLTGYTDTLEANVGSNADVASSTGSAHAKLKDLKTALSTIKSLPAGSLQISTVPSTDVTNTLLNITGSGWLLGAGGSGGNFAININSSGIKEITVSNNVALLWRFNTSCVVKCSNSASISNYVYAVLD